MQRVLCEKHKIVWNLSKRSLFNSNTISQSHHYKTFASSSSQQNAHSWLRRFVSNPMLAKKVSKFYSIAHVNKGFAACYGLRFPNRTNNTFYSSRSSWKTWLRQLEPKDVVLGLIIANVAVFLAWRVVDYRFMMNNFTISVENFTNGRLHTLITSAFSHIDLEHILHNMIGLYFFGVHLGHVFGPEFLLKLYFVGGIAGSVFYLVHSAYLASSSKELFKDPLKTPGLGASGAVNAIILLDIFLYPQATLFLNFFIPVPAVLLGIYLIGKDIMGMIEGETPGSAHLGGAVVAAVAWARLRRGRF